MIKIVYHETVEMTSQGDRQSVLATLGSYSGMGRIENIRASLNEEGNYEITVRAVLSDATFSDASSFAADLDAGLPDAWPSVTADDLSAV